MLELKRFEPRMIQDVVQLFRNTILTVNRNDYLAEQIEAWAGNSQTLEEWVARLQKSLTYVVVMEEIIVGFGNLTDEGLIDLLYVHKDHQGEGIGSKIVAQLECDARLRDLQQLSTEASITAKPFFLAHGFQVQRKQAKIVAETTFTNYRMIKTI